jgi:hypothetical protein
MLQQCHTRVRSRVSSSRTCSPTCGAHPAMTSAEYRTGANICFTAVKCYRCVAAAASPQTPVSTSVEYHVLSCCRHGYNWTDFMWDVDYMHPIDPGMAAIADLVAYLIQQTALSLLLSPLSGADRALLQEQLPAPMFNGERGGYFGCFRDERPLVAMQPCCASTWRTARHSQHWCFVG